MSDMAGVLAAHTFTADDTCACTCDEMFYDWRRTPEEVQVEHRLHVEERLSAAGFGPVQEARAALERVNILANRWEDRGQHDMDYSKTIPDEDIAMAILTDGAQKVENARHIRNAIKGDS